MKEKSALRIGIFDSGVGGLSVMHECKKILSCATYYYLGDNFRAPYGNRPAGEIERFVSEGLDAFCDIGVDAAVLACNTATAVCIEQMRKKYAFPIVGTEPALAAACRSCKKVLLICTCQTANSECIKTLLAHYPACNVTVYGALDLARLIERRLLYGETFDLAHELPQGEFDGVVLGCTHYIYMKYEIGKIFHGARIFDGNEGVARRLKGLCAPRSECMIGNNIHTCPQACPSLNMTYDGIYFLGNAQKQNKKVFFETFCGKNFLK